MLVNLEHSYVVSHKVPEILEAFEDGRFMFQDASAGVRSSRDCGAEQGRNLTENQHWTPPNAKKDGSYSSEQEFATTTAMVHQPDHFESHVEEDGNPTPTAPPLTELEIEYYPADLEPATDLETAAENPDVDNEEEFRINVVGQNILKSIETQRFKCLCPCRPTITSKSYNLCFQHLHKKHQMKIIIPSERCTLCEEQNKSVFKNIHTCARPPHPRKDMKWRQSAMYQ